jgi:diguanylate cyclase
MDDGAARKRGSSSPANAAAEDARRVLKTLAERRIIPTPDSFREVYEEVTASGSGGSAATVVKEMLRDLVRHNRLGGAEAGQILERAQHHDWLAVRDHIDRVLARRAGAVAGNWPLVAMQLVKSIDAVHANWTRARKLEAVSRVFEGTSAQPELALERLTRLMEAWGSGMAPLPPGPTDAAAPRPAVVARAPAEAEPPPAAVAPGPSQETLAANAAAAARADADSWRQIATRALRLLELGRPEGSPAREKLAEFTTQLAAPAPVPAAAAAAGADDAVTPQKLVHRFTGVVALLERQIDDEQRIRAGLQRLLALLCDNMKTLTPEESWLVGQLEPIRALLSGPIGTTHLAEAEARLSQVIVRQAGARRSLAEAKLVVREVMTTLIDQVGSMGSSTGRFYDQIGRYRDELERADDVSMLSSVVRGLLNDTDAVRGDIDRSRRELLDAKRRTEFYEARVKELERELVEVATLVMKDPLTHALNRRGLDEAFDVETARATRHATPLTLVMLDIDDFKMLNDRFGHVAGDQGLVHFSIGLRAGVRATDVIARSGGEEFALLLPATDVVEATELATRLLESCAAAPFEYDGVKLAMTCSAGVAGWRPGEPLANLTKRADAALYEAKRDGKNRVVASS